VKECKLYDMLDKINSKTEFLVSEPSDKDRPTLVPIPSIQNNPSLQFLFSCYIQSLIPIKACLL